MKEYLKISTRRWGVASLLFCMLVSAWLAIANYRPLGRTSPEVLFLLCASALLAEWKTIYIHVGVLYVRYNLIWFRRKISINRVSSAEIVIKNQDHTVLIALDGCLPFKKSKASTQGLYALMHPSKVVSIQCSKEDAFRCKKFLAANQIHTDVIIISDRDNYLQNRDDT